MSRRIAPLKEQLLELIALLEAGIDFAEDDVSVAPPAEILRRLEPVLEGTAQLAASFQYGGLVRAGLTLAIVGPAQRRQEQPVQSAAGAGSRHRDGDPRHHARPGLGDGVHRRHPGEARTIPPASARATELVESLGIERSYQAMADADLTLVVVDLSRPLDGRGSRR